MQSSVGEKWEEIVKGKAVCGKEYISSSDNSNGQRSIQIKNDKSNSGKAGSSMKADLNLGGKPPKQAKSHIACHEDTLRHGPSCSNSFGILEGIEGRIDGIPHNVVKCLEEGRKGNLASLPKLLKNDYVMEY